MDVARNNRLWQNRPTIHCTGVGQGWKYARRLVALIEHYCIARKSEGKHRPTITLGKGQRNDCPQEDQRAQNSFHLYLHQSRVVDNSILMYNNTIGPLMSIVT